MNSINKWLARRREARKSLCERKLEWVQKNYPRAWVNKDLEPRYRSTEDRLADERDRQVNGE